MKTIREYIDQLDEISRRDFLKGAGAATIGASTMSLPNSAQGMTDYEQRVMIAGIDLYYVCQQYSQNVDATLCKRVRNSLIRFANNTALGTQGLNEVYATAVQTNNQRLQTQKEDTERYFNRLYKDAESIIKMMDSQRPFNEDTLEETSEDPVAKIDALFRDK